MLAVDELSLVSEQLAAIEVNSIMLPARTMFQASKFLAKLTDLGTVTRIGKDTNNAAEQYNCC